MVCDISKSRSRAVPFGLREFVGSVFAARMDGAAFAHACNRQAWSRP